MRMERQPVHGKLPYVLSSAIQISHGRPTSISLAVGIGKNAHACVDAVHSLCSLCKQLKRCARTRRPPVARKPESPALAADRAFGAGIGAIRLSCSGGRAPSSAWNTFHC